MYTTAFARTLLQPGRRDRRRRRCRAQNPGSSHSRASFSIGVGASNCYTRRRAVQGGRAVMKSALISSSFCAAGDTISQALTSLLGEHKSVRIRLVRVMRMAAFGLIFYGPFQHVWYRALDFKFPTRTLTDFISKVVLNQIVLGPVVISASFSWNLTLTGNRAALPEKFRKDYWTTLSNGWKLWVPAAIANFRLIPVESQVLFMSFVSVCWTTYLGYQSNKALIQQSPAS